MPCVGVAPRDRRRRILAADRAGVPCNRGQRRPDPPRVDAQRNPFTDRCEHVQRDCQRRQHRRPANQPRPRVAERRGAREFALAQVRRRGEGRAAAAPSATAIGTNEVPVCRARSAARCVRDEGHFDAGGTAARARYMIEREHQLRETPSCAPVANVEPSGLRTKAATCARCIPSPMPWRRRGASAGSARMRSNWDGEVGDQAAACDDRLDCTVGTLRRYGDVLLFGGTGQLILERKCGRGPDAVGGSGGNCNATMRTQAAARIASLRCASGQVSGVPLPDCTTARDRRTAPTGPLGRCAARHRGGHVVWTSASKVRCGPA